MDAVVLDENTFCALIWFCLLGGGFIGWVASGMYHLHGRQDHADQFSAGHDDGGPSKLGTGRHEAPVSAESATDVGADQ